MIALLGAFASCDKIKQSTTEKVSSGAEQVAEGVKEAAENVAEEAAAAKEAVVTEVKEATEEVKAAAEETQDAVGLAEEHEVFAQKPDAHRPFAEVIAAGHRPPIAAQKIAAGRARSDAREKFVFFLAQHARPP